MREGPQPSHSSRALPDPSPEGESPDQGDGEVRVDDIWAGKLWVEKNFSRASQTHLSFLMEETEAATSSSLTMRKQD